MTSDNIEGLEVGDIVVLEVPDRPSDRMVFLSGRVMEVDGPMMFLFQPLDNPENEEYWFYSRVIINYGKGETNGS